MEITDLTSEWIGSGVSSPKIFNKSTGKTVVQVGDPKIQQSISDILSTPKGSRFFLPTYGSDLYTLVFEPNDYVLSDLIVMAITDALSLWEPRVQVRSVTPVISKGNHTVPVNISYTLTNSNILVNYVYLFERQISSL